MVPHLDPTHPHHPLSHPSDVAAPFHNLVGQAMRDTTPSLITSLSRRLQAGSLTRRRLPALRAKSAPSNAHTIPATLIPSIVPLPVNSRVQNEPAMILVQVEVPYKMRAFTSPVLHVTSERPPALLRLEGTLQVVTGPSFKRNPKRNSKSPRRPSRSRLPLKEAMKKRTITQWQGCSRMRREDCYTLEVLPRYHSCSSFE